MAGVEGGAALDGELVERQVVAGAVERPAELVAPGHRRLPGPGVDQVEGEAVEQLGGEIDRGERLRRAMAAAADAQRRAVERLHAERAIGRAACRERVCKNG